MSLIKNMGKKKICNLIFTFLIIILAIMSVMGTYTVKKAETFRYFTLESNIFGAVVALISLPFCFTKKTPKFVTTLKHAAALCLTLTFLTVFVYLVKVIGFSEMLSGWNIFMHLVIPVLYLVSHCFLDANNKISSRIALISTIPVAVYGLVYITMVFILGPKHGGWDDFYMFNAGGKWLLVLLIMIFSTVVISFIIMLIHNIVFKMTEPKEHIAATAPTPEDVSAKTGENRVNVGGKLEFPSLSKPELKLENSKTDFSTPKIELKLPNSNTDDVGASDDGSTGE